MVCGKKADGEDTIWQKAEHTEEAAYHADGGDTISQKAEHTEEVTYHKRAVPTIHTEQPLPPQAPEVTRPRVSAVSLLCASALSTTGRQTW